VPDLICLPEDRAAWLAARRRGVTATDITAIAGLSPYDSAYSLYWAKVEDSDPVENPDTPRLRLGRDLEHIIVQRFAEIYPEDVYIADSGLYRNGTGRPWMLATPDRVLFDENGDTVTGVLECKSWADADRGAWENGPPPQVRAQVLWQMDVLDVDAGHVAVLFLPSGEFASYEIRHEDQPGKCSPDCETCQDQALLISLGDDFWHHVENRQPPIPDGSAATLAALRARFPVRNDAAAEVDPDLWRELKNCRETVRAFKALAAEYEVKIREQAGDARTYTIGGRAVGYRVAFSSRVKEHTRTSDYIRISSGEDDDE